METLTIDPRTTPLDIGPDCEAPEDASVCSIWTDYPEAVNVEVAGRVLAEYAPLFAAAPALLEALEAVDKGYGDGGKLSREGMQEIARAALAPLKGE